MSMLSRAWAPRQGGRAVVCGLAILVASCSTSPPTVSPRPSAEPSQSGPACEDTGRPSAAPGAAWWSDAVFYELFVRSFADSNGDGIGDLRGATEHLDYLNDGDPATTDDLGVTALWLMPVAEATSYHGYDVTDYTAVEPDYGTTEDFRAFLDAAHERGIRVILDLVVNHTSREHPWFQDALTPGSEHDAWYVWSDTDPGWPAVAGGNPWHPSGNRFYYGAFSEGMPDLNLQNPEVTAELRRSVGVWLENDGVDGFRVDAAKHLIETGPDGQVNTPETHDWLHKFNDTLSPGDVFLGEVWEPRGTTLSYIEDGALDLVFDFGIGPAIMSAVRLGDPNSLEVNQAELLGRYPAGSAASFLTNHDQPRVITNFAGEVAAARQAAAALLTGPGTPFIYYGEELGMTGTKPDEQIRTPFPWSASGPGFGFTSGAPWEPFSAGADTANAASEASDERSILNAYRRLIQLRREHPALVGGEYLRAKASSLTVSAVLRTAGDDSLLIVQNLGALDAHDVTISIEASPLCGAPTGDLLYGAPFVDVPHAPSVGPGGRLEAWSLGPTLPAHATLVFDLSP